MVDSSESRGCEHGAHFLTVRSFVEETMRFYTGFAIICGSCGHRNRPHPSPRVAIRLTLLGQAGCCKECKKPLQPRELTDRPLVREIRAELRAQGIEPVC